jgi:hypothetical protein
MNLDGLARNLRVLWRADAIIAQAQLQHILMRLVLRALAAMVALFGLLSLELASYFSLVQRLDAIVAALILGAINLAIALAIVLISGRQRPTQDLKLAAELHKSAFEAHFSPTLRRSRQNCPHSRVPFPIRWTACWPAWWYPPPASWLRP